MKNSARVSEKSVSPGLPGLQVATRLIVSKTGGTDKDVKARIQKARNTFLMMKNIWKSGNIRLQT